MTLASLLPETTISKINNNNNKRITFILAGLDAIDGIVFMRLLLLNDALVVPEIQIPRILKIPILAAGDDNGVYEADAQEGVGEFLFGVDFLDFLGRVFVEVVILRLNF